MKKTNKRTVAMSPAFATLRPRVRKAKTPTPKRIVKAKPVPRQMLAKPFVPALLQRKRIVQEPFDMPGESVAARKLRERREKMQREKMEEKEREEARRREFKAHPVPQAVKQRLVPKKRQPLAPVVEPRPFQLQTDARHERHQRRLQEKVQKEEEERRRRVEFHAHPVPMFPKPQQPLKRKRPVLETEQVHLSTAMRAENRQAWDRQQKARIAMQEQGQQERLAREKAEQERRDRILRQQTVHKPTPYHKR
jgi:hypothetical protein